MLNGLVLVARGILTMATGRTRWGRRTAISGSLARTNLPTSLEAGRQPGSVESS